MAKKTKKTKELFGFGTADDLGAYTSEAEVIETLPEIGYDDDEEIFIYKVVKVVKLKKQYVEVK